MDWVILAGTVGHEASWTRGLPRPLLPLPRSTLISALLASFRQVSASTDTCTICANGHVEPITQHVELIARDTRRVDAPQRDIGFFEDSLPLGTAGCLKSCEPRLSGGTVFLTGGTVWLEDDPEWMLEQHRAQGNALTVFCAPGQALPSGGRRALLKPAGIYCCEPAVLDFIRPESYQDLKEQLVPSLQGAGLRVGAVTLRKPACQVSDWRSYNYVLHRALSEGRFQTERYRELAPGIWCGEDVSVAPDARIVGPALLGHRCRIDGGATVIGPTMLADECHVGAGSWLIRTIAPDRVHCPAGACFIDRFVVERHPTQVTPQSVQIGEAAASAPDAAADGKTTARSRLCGILAQPLLPVAALAGVFIWAFWHTISNLWQVWRTDADYSAGQLVPLAAVYMIATRRKLLEGVTLGLAPVGLMVFAVGLAVNLLGGYYLYSSLENVGMLVCLNGLALGLIGWSGYRHIWHPMVFLFLMLPLPNRVHDAVLLPLQGVGARISASILEIVGIPAVRAGHVLEVGGYRIAVAEACSGLRMAVAFLIVTAVFAYFLQRPRWQKVLVLLSSIPIAIACNVFRVVAAAYLYTIGYGWMAQGAFHDVTGLLMVPVALFLILAELWLLSRLVVYKDTVAALVHGADGTPVVTGH